MLPVIVSELCEEPSNWQNEGKLSTFIMTPHPRLYGVDTVPLRGPSAPGRHERRHRAGNDGRKRYQESSIALKRVAAATTREIAGRCCSRRRHGLRRQSQHPARTGQQRLPPDPFPAETKAEEVLAVNPDGIFLSNGPGDPKDVPYIVEEVKKMIGKKPIFGICGPSDARPALAARAAS